ncbi:hypothetical protein BBJ28_00017357 [Nothophytophthora sp. Chile5]|nr:hypothetical protein BBJ28_00017357 [Nothophytophthora sp. Chile5]
MEDERDEGHFDDQGNFVWNAEDKKVQEEAWLDDVSEQQIGEALHAKSRRDYRYEQGEETLTTEAANRTLATLLRPRESVLQALKRVSSKRNSRKKAVSRGTKRKQAQMMDTDDTPAQTDEEKRQFEQITDAADFLLRSGEVDVYSQMKEEFVPEEELLAQRRPGARVQFAVEESENKSEEHPPKPEVMWEYKTTDGQIHGPFPTSSFVAWQQQGYFKGGTAVDMRRVSGGDDSSEAKEEAETKSEEKPVAISAEQELLNDFEDSDEDEGVEMSDAKSQQTVGEPWKRSDLIDFSSY